jgi:hypothetical protein
LKLEPERAEVQVATACIGYLDFNLNVLESNVSRFNVVISHFVLKICSFCPCNILLAATTFLLCPSRPLLLHRRLHQNSTIAAVAAVAAADTGQGADLHAAAGIRHREKAAAAGTGFTKLRYNS